MEMNRMGNPNDKFQMSNEYQSSKSKFDIGVLNFI